MKKKLFICALVIGLWMLGGCHHYTNGDFDSNLVTKIVITSQTDTETVYRHYDDPQKMRQVLLYIRSISTPFATLPEPEEPLEQSISITTFSADQTVKTYQQKGTLYFQEGADGWQKIDPEKGRRLWMLIQAMPSDPE